MKVKAIIFDLDGVVYVGGEPCEGAAEGIAAAREDGMEVLFMTNNASRTPEQVAEHLVGMGIHASADEVLNSSQVGAAHLATLRDAGEGDTDPLVLAVGGPGVHEALKESGFNSIRAADVGPEGPPRPFWAVLQGYGPDMRVLDLHEAGYAINEGAIWVGTNADATLPTPRGIAPGNGALLAAVSHGTGATPDVVGKPFPSSYRIALERLGMEAAEVLAVGDRLDTDIEGANAAGLPSLLVLTGVDDRDAAAAAESHQTPTHIEPTIPDARHLWR
ncbi:MAG: HAD-IIA family hydrolase [Ornithinimicrobium sp.]